MTLARYLIGLGLLGVSIGPVVLGADAWRRRLLPEFVGPPGWLASGVLSLATVIVVSELLGTVGLFRVVPVTAALAAIGLVALYRARHGAENHRPELEEATPWLSPLPSSRTGRLGTLGAAAVGALVIGEWSARVVDVVRHGMATTDTLWYHLPVAAHFVQEGSTSHLHAYGQSYISYFPATSELVHALGIMFLGSDVLSLVLNLGWLALALFAGWCIGRPFGVAPLTLIGAALVFATPELVVDDAGSALNDVVGIALLLAAVALLAHAMHGDRDRPLRSIELVCIGLAAGLAFGTKYTLIAPAVALMIGTIAIGVRRPDVIRRAALCIVVGALGGGYWYLRNLFAVGNPLPTLRLGVGPLHLSTVPMAGTSSVSKFLFDGTAWSKYFLPGLDHAFGPVWWALAGVVIIGFTLGAQFGPGRFVRMIALVGVFSLLVFLFTPQILGGKVPTYFAPNARYAATGLALGLIVLPLALTRFGDWALRLVAAAYLVIALATQFGIGVWQRKPTLFAPVVRESSSLLVGAVIGVSAFGIGVMLVVLRARPSRSPRLHAHEGVRSSAAIATAVLAVLALVAASFGVSQFYLHRRYQNTLPLAVIYRWAQGVHDQRIAAVNFTSPYPLFGKDLSNRVEYVLPDGVNDTSSQVEHCAEWRRTVNRRRYRYVVVASQGFPFSRPNGPPSLVNQWTGSDPAAHLLREDAFADARAWLYEIGGELDPAGCAIAVPAT